MNGNPVLEAIYSRRAIRKYLDKPLASEQLESLVKAALLAPSAMNVEPWHITVVTDAPLIADWEKAIVQHFIDSGNERIIAHMASRNNKVFYDAPAVFVTSMEEDKDMDVGIMVENIAVAAKGLGLDSVILGFPRAVFQDQESAAHWQKALKFPEGYTFGIAIAVGYGDEPGRQREPDLSKVSYVG